MVGAESIPCKATLDFLEGENALLWYQNSYGEQVVCESGSKLDRADLAIALFDARETGVLPGDVKEVTLPGGEVFAIDADYGQDAKYGDGGWI